MSNTHTMVAIHVMRRKSKDRSSAGGTWLSPWRPPGKLSSPGGVSGSMSSGGGRLSRSEGRFAIVRLQMSHVVLPLT